MNVFNFCSEKRVKTMASEIIYRSIKVNARADPEYVNCKNVERRIIDSEWEPSFDYLYCGKFRKPRPVKVSFSAQYFNHEKPGQIYKSSPNLHCFDKGKANDSRNDIITHSSDDMKQRKNIKLGSVGNLKPGRKCSIKLKSYNDYLKQGRADRPCKVTRISSCPDYFKPEKVKEFNEMENVIPDYDNLQHENVNVLSTMLTQKSGVHCLNGFSVSSAQTTKMDNFHNYLKSKNGDRTNDILKLNGDSDHFGFGNYSKKSQMYTAYSNNFDYLKLGEVIFECQEFLNKKGKHDMSLMLLS